MKRRTSWSYDRVNAGEFSVNPATASPPPAALQAWPAGCTIVGLFTDAAVTDLDLRVDGSSGSKSLLGAPAIGSTGGLIPLYLPGQNLPPFIAGTAGAACTLTLILELG